MLLVVREVDRIILAKYDAWRSDCVDCANYYVEQNGLVVVDKEITWMGDMIWWVR